MFGSRKRIFAGKGNLHAEPLCPFITSKTGYSSFRKIADSSRTFSNYSGYIQAEPTLRTRKSKA